MGNRSGLTKIRLWHLGIAVAAGFVGTMLSLARVQRSASRSQDPEDSEAPHDPGREVAPRADQVSQVGRSYGLGDLIEFIRIRATVVLVVAGFGVMFLAIGIHESNWVNPTTAPTKASVIKSWVVNDQGDTQNYAYVRFKTKSGRIMHTTIEPNLSTVTHGQRIPILYNPAKPHEAGYAGLGGDSVYAPKPTVQRTARLLRHCCGLEPGRHPVAH